ncbi:hypothetical protein TNCV_4807701 [Trichonephila clavipes]|nr:hypothetical protein TNCV_4807701 [Trichonephila clavipes]
MRATGGMYRAFPKGLTGRVHVWRTPEQAYDRDGLLHTVRHGSGSVMIWTPVSWFFARPITILKGRIPGEKF